MKKKFKKKTLLSFKKAFLTNLLGRKFAGGSWPSCYKSIQEISASVDANAMVRCNSSQESRFERPKNLNNTKNQQDLGVGNSQF